MMFSFKYAIELEVCKTEEDPQEKLQLKVPSSRSYNPMIKTEGYHLKIIKLQLLFVIMPADLIINENTVDV